MALDHIDFTPPPSVEQPARTPVHTMGDVLAQVNSGLSWVRLEMPKTKDEKEKVVYELVVNGTFKTEIERNDYPQGISIKYIKDGVFSMKNNATGNVNYYLNEKGEILFNVAFVKKRRGIEDGKAFADLGLSEKKEWTRFDIYWANQLIDQESEEGFEMWNDVQFHADIIDTLSLLRTPTEYSEKALMFTIKRGWIRFQDIEAFRAKGIIRDEKLFQLALKELQNVLPLQCDPKSPIFGRLANYEDPYSMNDGKSTRQLSIYESDLKDYLKKGYITPELAKQCFQMLPKERRDVSGK